jgi:hypothetical protein
MKRLILISFLLLSMRCYSQAVQLSENTQISIITCGPSQSELYTAFGHSAIRIYDPSHAIDFIYNYGLFTFNQPNFYLHFAQGNSFYILGVESYPDFRYTYEYFNRFIHEQILNLSGRQKQAIFDFLQWNALPENKSYRYDYFFDNCATRVRDAFKHVLKNELEFDSSFIKTNYSIRELTDLYLEQQPWGDLGIDIGLGSSIDKKAAPHEYMFLPDYIESFFDHAWLIQNGDKIPLVKSKSIVFTPRPEPPEKSFFHPWIVFGVLFSLALGLSIWDWRRKKPSIWFDVLVLSVVGLTGIVLLLLWTATDHHACAKNLNLAWALPTHTIATVFLFRKNKPAWLRKYFLVVAGICAVLLLTWPVLPQMLNPTLIPVVATLFLRSVILFRI